MRGLGGPMGGAQPWTRTWHTPGQPDGQRLSPVSICPAVAHAPPVLQVLRDRHMGHGAPAPAAIAAAKLSRSCSSWCYRHCRSTWLLQALSSGRRPGRTWKSWWRKEAYPAADLSMSRAISREEHQFPSQVSLLWLNPKPHAALLGRDGPMAGAEPWTRTWHAAGRPDGPSA